MDEVSARKALLAEFLDEVWSKGNIATCPRYLSDGHVHFLASTSVSRWSLS